MKIEKEKKRFVNKEELKQRLNAKPKRVPLKGRWVHSKAGYSLWRLGNGAIKRKKANWKFTQSIRDVIVLSVCKAMLRETTTGFARIVEPGPVHGTIRVPLKKMYEVAGEIDKRVFRDMAKDCQPVGGYEIESGENGSMMAVILPEGEAKKVRGMVISWFEKQGLQLYDNVFMRGRSVILPANEAELSA